MTTQISVETISLTVHQNTLVITTELLACLYGTEPLRIRNNFSRNKARFVEGKHYFLAKGDALENLRVSLRDSQNPIANNVRALTLWTERGAARHAKMLETDQAWEVFEKLEDCYFSKKAEPIALGAINLDIFLAIRDDKVAFIKHHQAGTLITIENALSILRQRDWLVMPREELAGRLMEL